MPIEIEKPNLRVSKCQSDIMEDYKSFITKGFKNNNIAVLKMNILIYWSESNSIQF